MQLLEKKVKCPLCGAKNPKDARRCTICTRPLANDPLPSQAVYDEALWSTKIASKGSRQKTNPLLLLVTALALALLANYFVFGLGPSWAHEPEVVPKGFEWKVYDADPRYKADLPGLPITETIDAAGTTFTAATVWVDSEWHRIRDAETNSVAAIDSARKKLHAKLVTASAAAPSDVAAQIPAIVGALAPGSVLADGGVRAVEGAPLGEQFDYGTTYSGWPDESSTGVVRARVIVVDDTVLVAASFVNGADDGELMNRLASAFQPTS